MTLDDVVGQNRLRECLVADHPDTDRGYQQRRALTYRKFADLQMKQYQPNEGRASYERIRDIARPLAKVFSPPEIEVSDDLAGACFTFGVIARGANQVFGKRQDCLARWQTARTWFEHARDAAVPVSASDSEAAARFRAAITHLLAECTTEVAKLKKAEPPRIDCTQTGNRPQSTGSDGVTGRMDRVREVKSDDP